MTNSSKYPLPTEELRKALEFTDDKGISGLVSNSPALYAYNFLRTLGLLSLSLPKGDIYGYVADLHVSKGNKEETPKTTKIK